MLIYIFDFLNDYSSALGVILAALAFGWPAVQFLLHKRHEAKTRDFETYHKLVKELVEPPENGNGLFVDRQTAIIYEFRFFPRYWEHTERMLLALKEKWLKTAPEFKRLHEEIDNTVNHIRNKKKWYSFSSYNHSSANSAPPAVKDSLAGSPPSLG